MYTRFRYIGSCEAGQLNRLEVYVIHSTREMQDMPASQQLCIDPVARRNVAVDREYLIVQEI